MASQQIKNVLVHLKDFEVLGTLAHCMLGCSRGKPLPKPRVMLNEVKPLRQVVLRVQEEAGIPKLHVHPLKIIFNELAPFMVSIKQTPRSYFASCE